MADKEKRPPAEIARIGGPADLMAGDANEIKGDLKREAPRHPQGAGGIDPAEDADKKAKKRARQRTKRVLR